MFGPIRKGQKNDFRDAEAIAEAVQRPTMKFVATKTSEQLDLQALHRVRERLVSQRTGIINQIRAFLLERGFAVRQGNAFCAPSCRAFSALPPRTFRLTWHGSSRIWLAIGDGWMSALIAYLPR
jgi:transposase